MLKVEHLQKHYKDFSLDCSFCVPPGRITGLIGQNGAGKTTAFKAILGLIRADGGTIRLFGKDIGSFTEEDRQQLGIVLADSGPSGYLTIADLPPILKQIYHHFDPAFFMEYAKKFRLPEHKKIKEFSTGMKAKLKILIAVSHNAKLLILDEPTAGLDVVARDELLDLLRGYMEQDEERSILISSHISSDLAALCDDLYMIHAGSIIMHEDTDVLLDRYALLKLTDAQFDAIDKNYILKTKQESFGFHCLTNEKQFYTENYPQIVIENITIDEVISMMILGQ